MDLTPSILCKEDKASEHVDKIENMSINDLKREKFLNFFLSQLFQAPSI